MKLSVSMTVLIATTLLLLDHLGMQIRLVQGFLNVSRRRVGS
jgi:hypothetical protein